MVVAGSLVLPVDYVFDLSYVALHALEGVDARRIRVNLQKVFLRLADVVAILVVNRDAVEADVEEVTMS